jgi:hypothetical protein
MTATADKTSVSHASALISEGESERTSESQPTLPEETLASDTCREGVASVQKAVVMKHDCIPSLKS